MAQSYIDPRRVMQMRHYEEDEEGVTLHFDCDQAPVRAKVLVGADGYFSKVRTQCLNDGPPAFNVSYSPSHSKCPHQHSQDKTLHPHSAVSVVLHSVAFTSEPYLQL